jgi:hypothetical protein
VSVRYPYHVGRKLTPDITVIGESTWTTERAGETGLSITVTDGCRKQMVETTTTNSDIDEAFLDLEAVAIAAITNAVIS